MIPVLSVENMRKSDSAAIASGIPGRELMRLAGEGIFRAVQWKRPAAVVCGSGNNAGDGYVVAALLREAGLECTVYCVSDRFSEDGRYWADRCLERGAVMRPWKTGTDLSGFGTVVDCLFGTGFRGEVTGAAREAVEAINASGAQVISADINSGLNGDSGLGACCVKSDVTVAIGGFKPGHFLNMAKDVIGARVNCDIGIAPVDTPYQLLERQDVIPCFRPRRNYSNKGTYGYTALIGGSARYSGAIRLAAMAAAAMRCGAGVVKAAVPASLMHDVAPAILESTLFPLPDRDGEMRFDAEAMRELTANVRTAAFGMGIGVTEEAGKALAWLMDNYHGTLIVDADGLTLLARMERSRLREAACSLVLTPHLKEFSRLTGMSMEEITRAPAESARDYARETGAVVLLKGPATIVTDGTAVILTDAGCAGMATAGSGDVLSGILAALCGWIPDRMTAAAAGAYINGLAGEAAQRKMGSISMTAGDTARCIAETVRDLERDASETV